MQERKKKRFLKQVLLFCILYTVFICSENAMINCAQYKINTEINRGDLSRKWNSATEKDSLIKGAVSGIF